MRCVKLTQSHFICLFILNTFLVYSTMYNPVPVQRSRVDGNGKVRFVTYTLSSWIDPVITSNCLSVYFEITTLYFKFYDILLRY